MLSVMLENKRWLSIRNGWKADSTKGLAESHIRDRRRAKIT